MEWGEIINNKENRIEAGKNSFWFWHQYHFGWLSKKFTRERADSLQSNKNTLIEAFRASRKTSLVRSFICWCIVYKKEPSIIVQSYEDSLSSEWVREVAKMLFKESVVADHGMCFPLETKKEDLAKKSLSNFESTTGVKIAAKSLGQTIRGTNTFDMDEEISARPTLLVLEDIDVMKSVENVEIINKNENKILSETIGALDPLRRKIIFLGNTIKEDGVVPRFRERYKTADSWNVFHQPLFNDKGENVRPEVFTDEVVQQLRDDGIVSFNQNYMLIPSQTGTGVFVRNYFDYFLLSHFEDADGILKKNDLKCGLFIDPAFSSSDSSNDAVVIAMGEHNTSKKYYLLDGYADTSAPSKTLDAVIVMYNNMVADGFTPRFISVENVLINKNQTKFVKDLRDKLIEHQINIPVYLYEPKTNKEGRIKDNLESIMSQQGIKFNRNIRHPNFINKMEKQFLDFPFCDHDDIIDCVSQSIEVFRKKTNEGQTKKKLVKRWNVDRGEFVEVYL